MTREGDLVLVYMDGKAAFFARIEAIESDPKPEWFQVTMLVLQVPLATITWILRDPYINGTEFTMGGHPMRLEKVVSPALEEQPDDRYRDDDEDEDRPKEGAGVLKAVAPKNKGSKEGKVVSLFDRPRKNQPS